MGVGTCESEDLRGGGGVRAELLTVLFPYLSMEHYRGHEKSDFTENLDEREMASGSFSPHRKYTVDSL